MSDFSGLHLGLIHQPHPRLVRIGEALAGQTPPAAIDWHKFITLDGDALGNDVESDCVEAAVLRAIQIMRAVAGGDVRRPQRVQAETLYEAWTREADGSGGWDGVPGSASDTGTISARAAALWASQGVGWGAFWNSAQPEWRDVPALAGLDPTILSHLRAAIAWLGPVQLDLNLPVSAQRQSVWDAAEGDDGQPGSWGAHRVCVGKYDADRFYAITWGMEMPMTGAFVARYALDATAAVSRSWLDTLGHSPLQLDLDALEAASRALAA